MDSAWEQRKLEARKMLENAADSPASSARGVGTPFGLEALPPILQTILRPKIILTSDSYHERGKYLPLFLNHSESLARMFGRDTV